MNIALVGDYQESVPAHKAIPLALQMAADQLSASVEFTWVDSTDVSQDSLSAYSGLWCVPASPYENTENVLQAINYARENDMPFLGTCGGYQHAALEFARNALAYREADNAEINPEASMPLISGLSCKLYDEQASINLLEDSFVASLYGTTTISEEYFCGYGVNRDYLTLFDNTDMKFSGFDEEGDPRALEITRNRFFVGTAFQPERSAFKNIAHPVIIAFLKSTITS